MIPHLVAPCCALLGGCWSRVGSAQLLAALCSSVSTDTILSVCLSRVCLKSSLSIHLIRHSWKGDASASCGCSDPPASEARWGFSTLWKLHGCTVLGQVCRHLGTAVPGFRRAWRPSMDSLHPEARAPRPRQTLSDEGPC